MKNKSSFEFLPENSKTITKILRYRSEVGVPHRLEEGIDRALELCTDPEAEVKLGLLRESSSGEVVVHVAGIEHAFKYLIQMPALIGRDSNELDRVTLEFEKTSSLLAEMRKGVFGGVVEREDRLIKTIEFYRKLLEFANSGVGKTIYRNVVEQIPGHFWQDEWLKIHEIIRDSCAEHVVKINTNQVTDVRKRAFEELCTFRTMMKDPKFEVKTNPIGPYMKITTIDMQYEMLSEQERFHRRSFRWYDHEAFVVRCDGDSHPRPQVSEQLYKLALEPVVSRRPMILENPAEHNSDFGFAYFPEIQISKNISVVNGKE